MIHARLISLAIMASGIILAAPGPARADLITCTIHVDNLADSMVIDTEGETATVTSKLVPDNQFVFQRNGTFNRKGNNNIHPNGPKDKITAENFDAVRPLAVKAIKTSACP